MKVKFFVRTFLTLAALIFATASYAADGFQTIDGKTISAADLKGKWVLVNYWASWCPACRAEIADLNAFYQANKNKVILLGVNHDDAETPAELRAAVKKAGIHFPVLMSDPAERLGITGVTGLPTTFVLNPEGKLVKVLAGSQTKETLESAVS